MLTNFTVVIILQCTRVSNHHLVHLKHTELCVNYMAIKLGKSIYE